MIGSPEASMELPELKPQLAAATNALLSLKAQDSFWTQIGLIDVAALIQAAAVADNIKISRTEVENIASAIATRGDAEHYPFELANNLRGLIQPAVLARCMFMVSAGRYSNPIRSPILLLWDRLKRDQFLQFLIGLVLAILGIALAL